MTGVGCKPSLRIQSVFNRLQVTPGQGVSRRAAGH